MTETQVPPSDGGHGRTTAGQCSSAPARARRVTQTARSSVGRALSDPPGSRGAIAHAAVVLAAFTLLFTWLFATPIVEGSLIAESDMYEQFLPVFLSPYMTWSSYEFGGMPAFADPQDTVFYPVHFLFARVVGSWTGFIVSAFVLTSVFTYAYVYSLTRSRAAAAFAGLAFGLSEATIERLAHVTTIHAIPWLPLMLLSIDRIRQSRGGGWMAVGAIAVASCILGGHPQIVLYFLYACGLYAVVGGIAERAGWGAWARLAAALGIGIALTGVKAVPLLETAALTARQSLDVAGFVSHSNTPQQMLSALLPAVAHEGREAPTYVGLAALVFAIAAATRPFRNWRIAFWLALALVAALLGIGAATPVTEWAYELPMYDRFRVVARHLILACFGVVVLAGFGVAAIAGHEAARRRVFFSLGTVGVLLAAGTVAVALSPAAFGIGEPFEALRRQWAVAAATALACAAFARRPESVARLGALAAVIAADLLIAQPHPITRTGLDVPRIPGDAARPSVHAQHLGAAMRADQHRLLAPAGTQLDAVVPGAFARVWEIPIAGGYGPMLLGRHSALAMMGTNGSVDPLTLAADNTALDVLAVKYVVLNEGDLRPSGTFEREGITWASRPIGVAVGPRECGQRHPRSVTYALPPTPQASALALVVRLRCSEDVPQGTEVARLTVFGEGGERVERPLAAGIDVAEGALSDPALRRRARHDPSRVFEDEGPLLSYLVRFDFPDPLQTARLQIDLTGTPGWLDLERVSVVDVSGHSIPAEAPAFLLDGARWQEAARVATSRVTDRFADEEHAAETRYVAFENRRAMPRAWVASEVLPLSDREMLEAVHHSILPDGRRFSPAATALVQHGTLPAGMYPDGGSAAIVRTTGRGRFTVDVTTAGGGVLVLSESYYPGWRARIDGDAAPIHPVNVSLQGVPVPAGRHFVEFEFAPATLRAGAAVSLASVGLLLLCAWRGAAARRAM